MTRVLLPFFLLLSTSTARTLTSPPENERPQKTGDVAGGIAMNIDVGSQMDTKEPGKSSDERNMPASGSFPVRVVGGEEKRLENGKVLPVAPNWRPINRHFNRMQLIRRTFPAIDGDDVMIRELENPRFIFHRHHDEEEDQITIHKGHASWEKMRNFLANL